MKALHSSNVQEAVDPIDHKSAKLQIISSRIYFNILTQKY